MWKVFDVSIYSTQALYLSKVRSRIRNLFHFNLMKQNLMWSDKFKILTPKWQLLKILSNLKYYCQIIRSSRRELLYKKVVLKNFAKFTEKHLCWSLFSRKVADVRPATLPKNKLRHKYFHLNFAKSLSSNFL